MSMDCLDNGDKLDILWRMREAEVIVVGAGVGGLVAALCLSHAGLRVTVVERTHEVGGKMHVVRLGDREVDAGPTVLTMRGVFDRVLGEVGARLDDELSLRPLRRSYFTSAVAGWLTPPPGLVTA